MHYVHHEHEQDDDDDEDDDGIGARTYIGQIIGQFVVPTPIDAL